jgi:hypothetical protein
MAQRLVRFQEGMKPGFGYDLLNGTPKVSPAVQGTISPIPQAEGQLVTSSFLRIDDLQTLHETIGVNVDAGGSYFGISADVKVQYAKECTMSQFATHVMVRVSVQDAFESFDNPVLSDDAKDLLQNDTQRARFRERFGDVFIAGLQKGGEYFATWEITSVDQSVRESIATLVEGSFNDLLASGHLDVDVKNAAASSSSHVEVRVHVFQAGSIDHTDQTMAEIMKKAHDFPPTVAGKNAFPYAVSLADYRELQLPNDRFDFLDIENQRDVLAELARKRFEFLSRRNSISYARQQGEEFVGGGDAGFDAALAGELAKITDAINQMEKLASACLRDAKQCTFPSFDVSDFPLPTPKPPSTSDLALFLGRWQHTTIFMSQSFTSIWHLFLSAREEGLGNATGTAVFEDGHLQISWQTSTETGTYDWELDAAASQGDGILRFTTGSRAGTSSTKSHVKRLSRGVYQHTTIFMGQSFTSIWHLAPTVSAQEEGLGNATGSAVLRGGHLVISWLTPSEAGTYDWKLDPALTQGDGALTFTSGSRAGKSSTASQVRRL